MIKLIPYAPAHMDILTPTAADLERYGELSSKIDNPLADHGISFTGLADGRVLFVCGILPVSRHTGFAWSIIGQHAPAHGLRVFRAIKRQMETMMETLTLHRVETANLVGATQHHRWCELLGFREEGPLWQYDDQGRDYIRFAKLMPRQDKGE